MPQLNQNILIARRTGDYINPDGTLRKNNGLKGRENNNTAVIGAAGSGKTNGAAMQDILSGAGGASMIISDTKNTIKDSCAPALMDMGYDIIVQDYVIVKNSSRYNYIEGIATIDDIPKYTDIMVYNGVNRYALEEPFWKDNEKILLGALLGYMVEGGRRFEKNFKGLSEFVSLIDADCMSSSSKCDAIKIFESHRDEYKRRTGKESWAYGQFRKFIGLAERTLSCIIAGVNSDLQAFDSHEMHEMTSCCDFDIKSIADKKTAVFINVSDTDRSKDKPINLFYTQAMDILCRYADELPEKHLPVPVRFILDDFGSSSRIEGFENMISNIRSRGISTMILFQSIAQLKQSYGEGYNTILANCGTQFYMGGSDPETAQYFSLMTNKPVAKILNMPYMTHWQINRYGAPKFGNTLLLDRYALKESELIDKGTEKL